MDRAKQTERIPRAVPLPVHPAPPAQVVGGHRWKELLPRHPRSVRRRCQRENGRKNKCSNRFQYSIPIADSELLCGREHIMQRQLQLRRLVHQAEESREKRFSGLTCSIQRRAHECPERGGLRHGSSPHWGRAFESPSRPRLKASGRCLHPALDGTDVLFVDARFCTTWRNECTFTDVFYCLDLRRRPWVSRPPRVSSWSWKTKR